MAFTQRGEEVIAGAESHIYNLEVGGLAGCFSQRAFSINAADPVNTAPKGAASPFVKQNCTASTD